MSNEKQPHIAALGGAFIHSENPKELAEWYKKHLGLDYEGNDEYGTYYVTLPYIDIATGKKANMVWAINRTKNRPQIEGKIFTINYRVHDLERTVTHLRELGLTVKGIDEYPGQGKFAWVYDPEGNKVELWEDTEME